MLFRSLPLLHQSSICDLSISCLDWTDSYRTDEAHEADAVCFGQVESATSLVHQEASPQMITKLRGYVATFFRDPKKPKVQRLGKYRDGKAQLLLWLKFFPSIFCFTNAVWWRGVLEFSWSLTLTIFVLINVLPCLTLPSPPAVCLVQYVCGCTSDSVHEV